MIPPSTHASPHDEEVAGAVELGGRLRGILRAVLDLAPPSDRTGHSLTNHLPVEGATARRIIRATRDGIDELEVLSRSPAPDSLRRIARAGEGRLDAFVLAELLKAADRLDALSHRHHGRSNFIRALRDRTLGQNDLHTLKEINPKRAIASRHILILGDTRDGVRPIVDATTGQQWGSWLDRCFMPHASLRSDVTGKVIMWSGGLDEEAPFARDPRAWSPAALDALVAHAQSHLRTHSDSTLILRPHARHILGDLNRCNRYTRDHGHAARQSLGFALDPASLLEPSMLPSAHDHLARSFATLAKRSDLLILTGLLPPDPEWSDDPDASPLQACPCNTGVLDPVLIGDLIREHCPIELPLLFPFSETDAQLAALDPDR